MVECNRDCLNCPYPDVPEECLEAPLSLDDYRELDWLDREIIRPKTERQKKASAKKRAYYEANREEIVLTDKYDASIILSGLGRITGHAFVYYRQRRVSTLRLLSA